MLLQYIIGHNMCCFNANKRQTTLKGQSKMDNTEKLATQGTQDTGQINVRQLRETGNTRHRTNKRQTTQRNWQQDGEKQIKSQQNIICVRHHYT